MISVHGIKIPGIHLLDQNNEQESNGNLDNAWKIINKTEYQISNRIENHQSTIFKYVRRPCSNWISDWTQREFYMQAKEGYLNQVHSDQMVFKIVRLETEPREQWLKATQGGPSGSSPLRSDGSHDGQAGRLDCWELVSKDAQNKLNLKGDYQAPVYSGQMLLVVVRQGGGTAVTVAKDAQERAGKRL